MAPKIKGEAERKCSVAEIRNGVLYRCSKQEGHELRRGDEEHEVYANEYAVIDWRALFEASKPLLEWMAANPQSVGQEKNEAARRILIRAYTASGARPGIVKTKLQ